MVTEIKQQQMRLIHPGTALSSTFMYILEKISITDTFYKTAGAVWDEMRCKALKRGQTDRDVGFKRMKMLSDKTQKVIRTAENSRASVSSARRPT